MKESKYNEFYIEDIPVIGGSIYETGERCQMQANGFWVGEKGRRITSYIRIDKNEPEGIFRQYSMDRHHRFFIESEDRI